jgi:hypothetical protein
MVDEVKKEDEVEVKVDEELVEDKAKTPEEIAESLFDKTDKEEVKEDEVKKEDEAEVDADDAKQDDEQEETDDKKEPKELELSLSKDSPLDEGYIEAILEYAKENGKSQEEAQEILTHKEDAVSDFMVDTKAKADTEADEGLKDLKAKYGVKFEEAQELALKPYKDPRFVGDSDEQKRIVDFVLKTRLADDPVFFEWSRKIGLAMSDDTYLKGNTPVKKKLTMEEKFYGKEAANKE